LTVTALKSRRAVPAVPLKVGRTSFVELLLAGDVSVIVGAVVSTVNVFAELWPVLPAASLCSARAV
jgi:hypothetical protein